MNMHKYFAFGFFSLWNISFLAIITIVNFQVFSYFLCKWEALEGKERYPQWNSLYVGGCKMSKEYRFIWELVLPEKGFGLHFSGLCF